jgi:hypothetical protein
VKSLWAQALRILVFAAVVLAAGTLFHPSFAGAGETIFNPKATGPGTTGRLLLIRVPDACSATARETAGKRP